MTSTIDDRTEAARAPQGRRHLFSRALAGVIAAGVVLAVGELLSVLIDQNSSPFYAVGSTTVDRSPAWAREFAISTFGTNDKPALFVGMTVLIAAFAAVAGILERQGAPFGSALLMVLGGVGVYAATHRPSATWVYAVPTLAGLVVGIVVLRILTVAAQMPEGNDGVDSRWPRRKFLVLAATAAAAVAATGAAGRYLGQRIAGAVDNRNDFAIPSVVDKASPIAPGTDIGVPGGTSFVTANDEFYRIDTALRVPRMTTDNWELHIHGMVERELTLTWDDLVARTPVERMITLTCVSNEVGGILAGNATWIGYPIKNLLDEVGVDPEADMLLSTSIDDFTAGTPVEALRDGRDAMLAVAMNGQPLPFEHGYPVRQVVPGLYGYVSATKWVVEWELTRFDAADAYWTKRGWAEKAPIKTASRIDVPAPFAPLVPGPVLVAGTAWAQRRGIETVEVRVDNGPWEKATLARQYTIDTWRQWTWEWQATPGLHTLQVRATDLAGNVQVEKRMPPIPGGATGWHTRSFTVA
ncbi:molybdopterin-dependent oxidoreductase [Rhodococcus tibetensis]|uniref:Molybdopterin-dependent oxidoreductase n=1 Tax=Rhodococcus tibetensis TaxID=2965064 RepID=A0ABT1QIB9_9NOCA|nr:molybdopterin-dependent oxidoreductase [Rhodococcus sp. FXJ9.536]MCQ4122033.1 molybdopterin-dependent oxidoreductase [Rhodococcus sp. FXJ9.536]